MPRTITLRLSDQSYRAFVEAAEAERRSISNLIETAALERIREDQFVDDLEMAEIRSNEDLVKRLKQGSRDARNRKGRFVE
jgi:hypothetical protein